MLSPIVQDLIIAACVVCGVGAAVGVFACVAAVLPWLFWDGH